MNPWSDTIEALAGAAARHGQSPVIKQIEADSKGP
jgi:hypothetical protein